jgi:Gpi18-like mannosyltransferase
LKTPTVLNKIPYSLRIVIAIILSTKLLVFILGFIAFYYSRGPAPPLSILMNQFYHWDSLYYISIAKEWYVNQGAQQNFIAFFPLYPILIRLTTFSYDYVNLSALLVSNVSSAIAGLYLFKLVKLDFDENAAVKAVLYLCVFPTAFFLSTMYTEGLFLALSIASFFYARTGKWATTGFLSLFACLTRLGGLVLFPALLVEYLHQKKWNLRKADLNVLWIFLAVAGFLIYLGINNLSTGNPFTFLNVESVHWHQTFNPLMGLALAVQVSTTGTFPVNLLALAQLIFASLALFATVESFRLRLRLSYNVYMLLTWMLIVSTSLWNSIPRYVLTLFPMFILMGISVSSKKIHYFVALSSLGIMCVFTVIFALGKFVF